MADLCQSLYCQTTLAHTSREDILDKTMRTEVWKHLSAITSGEISVCYKAGQQLKAGVQMWRGGHPHGPVLTILSCSFPCQMDANKVVQREDTFHNTHKRTVHVCALRHRRRGT